MNAIAELRPFGLSADTLPLEETLERVRIAEAFGVDQVWLGQMPDQRDLGTVVAAYLSVAQRIVVGTGVLPVYPRHPAATAQLAATLDEWSGGRFILGLGLSHPFVNDFLLGIEQGPPLRVMREYVTIVRELLTTGRTSFDGKEFTARASYNAPRRADLPIYLAGLRPKMIRLAVEIGDGVVLWLCSARYVEEVVVPTVRRACAQFGKDADGFPIIAMLPTYVSPDSDAAVQQLCWQLAGHAMMPYYQQVLRAAGLRLPGADGRLDSATVREVALVGDRYDVRAAMGRYRTAGVVPTPLPMPCDRATFMATIEATHGD